MSEQTRPSYQIGSVVFEPVEHTHTMWFAYPENKARFDLTLAEILALGGKEIQPPIPMGEFVLRYTMGKWLAFGQLPKTFRPDGTCYRITNAQATVIEEGS